MCLYPRLITNPKYKPNKKNGGNTPAVSDIRTTLVPIGCGECKECRHQKRREWQIRLLEEIRTTKERGHMVTLTFSTEWLKYLNDHEHVKITNGKSKIKIPIHSLKGYDKDNAIAKRAIELFRERWRKQYGTAMRRWLITELGGGRYEHMHIHGIIWTNEPKEQIQKHWQYGNVWSGNYERPTYVNERTIAYIIKYVTKKDAAHPYYKPIILCSPGIGKSYAETTKILENKYNENGTNETYKTSTGHRIALPIYYRNKVYTDEEKEKLWIEKLDKNIRWVNKQKYDISNGDTEYKKALAYAQKQNIELGYGDGNIDWDEKRYEEQKRQLLYNNRIGE